MEQTDPIAINVKIYLLSTSGVTMPHKPEMFQKPHCRLQFSRRKLFCVHLIAYRCILYIGPIQFAKTHFVP